MDCSLKVGSRVRVSCSSPGDPCLKQVGTIRGFMTQGSHLDLSAVVECESVNSLTTVFIRWLAAV
jgi:hypothetical protein